METASDVTTDVNAWDWSHPVLLSQVVCSGLLVEPVRTVILSSM
jgi:hypothetical protein